VVSFNTSAKTVSVEGEGDVPYDKLIVCTGFNYAPTDPGIGHLTAGRGICVPHLPGRPVVFTIRNESLPIRLIPA